MDNETSRTSSFDVLITAKKAELQGIQTLLGLDKPDLSYAQRVNSMATQMEFPAITQANQLIRENNVLGLLAITQRLEAEENKTQDQMLELDYCVSLITQHYDLLPSEQQQRFQEVLTKALSESGDDFGQFLYRLDSYLSMTKGSLSETAAQVVGEVVHSAIGVKERILLAKRFNDEWRREILAGYSFPPEEIFQIRKGLKPGDMIVVDMEMLNEADLEKLLMPTTEDDVEIMMYFDGKLKRWVYVRGRKVINSPSGGVVEDGGKGWEITDEYGFVTNLLQDALLEIHTHPAFNFLEAAHQDKLTFKRFVKARHFIAKPAHENDQHEEWGQYDGWGYLEFNSNGTSKGKVINSSQFLAVLNG